MLNINFWDIAFTIINIVVLYLFLKHFLMKPLMSILEERKQMVEKELQNSLSADNLFPSRISPLRLAVLFYLYLSTNIQLWEVFPDKQYAG